MTTSTLSPAELIGLVFGLWFVLAIFGAIVAGAIIRAADRRYLALLAAERAAEAAADDEARARADLYARPVPAEVAVLGDYRRR